MVKKVLTKRIALGTSVLILGTFAPVGPSRASAQSSTNCMVMGGGLVHCDTMGMGTMRQPSPDGGAALGRGIRALIERSKENSLRKKLGKMVADGDCQGAARLAYEKGRLEWGSAITQTCVRR